MKKGIDGLTTTSHHETLTSHNNLTSRHSHILHHHSHHLLAHHPNIMISLSKTLASFNDKEWDAMERATAKLRALTPPPSKVKPQSGVKGITWHPQSSKWVTRAYINRKVEHVGTFFDLEDAIEAQKDYYHAEAS